MKEMLATIAIIIFLTMFGCNSYNLEYLKYHATSKWEKQGFNVVDYEGYKRCPGIGYYGGASVWHRLKKIPDNGITYSGSLWRWGDEIHVYGPIAIDAIKP